MKLKSQVCCFSEDIGASPSVNKFSTYLVVVFCAGPIILTVVARALPRIVCCSMLE